MAMHRPSTTIYAVSEKGKMWKISLGNLKGKWKEQPHKGLCYHISMSGDDIYCRGSHKEVWHQKINSISGTSKWTKVAKGSVMSVMVPKLPPCRGTLLNRKDDGYACDTISEAKTCDERYERVGKTDRYLQCVPSTGGPGLTNCLARDFCEA